MAVSANRLELLQIADAVAREKAIDRMIVVTAMEDAIQKAARSRYGQETDVRAEINSKTGEIKLQRLLKVVDEVENPATDILVEEARRKNPAAQAGDYIAEPLPPMDFGRIAAQSAKQVIVQKVREAERDRQYDEYQGPHRRDRQRPGQAGRVRQRHRRSRPRRGHRAPRRADPARVLPLRRPHPRLYLRRPPRAARAADLPVPHPSRSS